MRLSQIVVENHSRISDLEIRVGNHLVLVGANDVWKTSLLRLLNFLLGSSTAQLYAALGKDDLRDQGKRLIVSGKLVDFEDPRQRKGRCGASQLQTLNSATSGP